MKRRTCIVDHKYENTRYWKMLTNFTLFINDYSLVRCLNTRKPKSRDSETEIPFQQLFEKISSDSISKKRNGNNWIVSKAKHSCHLKFEILSL